ncbi:MAG: hypothetical protein HY423_16160 [Candidatus Lambdaproteobacteria bacterium]|nr:hypothetical protein [Candidatus Lambdaproteobacteria bacterium]
MQQLLTPPPRAAPWRVAAGLLAVLALALGAAPAQAVTFTEQIERLQAVYAALLDYRAGAPPRPSPGGEIGLELLPVPPIDNRVGSKDEPVHPPPAIARLRLGWSAAAGLRIGAVWLPPVKVMGYRANVAGVEGGWGLSHGAAAGALRVFYLAGSVAGPISDPDTTDTFTLANRGADLRLGWARAAWVLYGGAGAGRSETRLAIASDGSESAFGRAYRYAFLGLSRTAGAWRFTLEQHATESILRHVVLTVSHGF